MGLKVMDCASQPSIPDKEKRMRKNAMNIKNDKKKIPIKKMDTRRNGLTFNFFNTIFSFQIVSCKNEVL